MTLTSIIIPTYNGLSYLADCIASIRAYTTPPYEIVVVDNGSTDGTTDFCRRESLRFVSLPDNRGFPAACNAGLRLASGDRLLLLNNDVIVSHRWLDNMADCLDHARDVGIVGPYTNYASGKQRMIAPYETIGQYHEMAIHLNAPNPYQWLQVDRLVGFCFLFKRELYERIGELDERFSPGHYEDDDYCYRARLAGYRLMIAGDTVVHHHGSASFFKQDEGRLAALIDRNHRLFVEKWGVDPLAFV